MSPSENAEFGQRLAHFRRLARLTQKALAERTGIDVKRIQRYEYGAYPPKEQNLRLLAAALCVLPEQLLGDAWPPDAGTTHSNPVTGDCVTSRSAAMHRPELAPLLTWMVCHNLGVVTVVDGGSHVSVMTASADLSRPGARSDAIAGRIQSKQEPPRKRRP